MLKVALVAVALFATVTTALAQSSGGSLFPPQPNPAYTTPSWQKPPAKTYKRTSKRAIYRKPQRPSYTYAPTR